MSNSRKGDLRQLALMFKALANPNRLRIFLQLVSCCRPGTHCDASATVRECVGALGRDLAIVPSTVSHHIKALHQAGLIHMERRGQRVECWVDPATLRLLSEFFQHQDEQPLDQPDQSPPGQGGRKEERRGRRKESKLLRTGGI